MGERSSLVLTDQATIVVKSEEVDNGMKKLIFASCLVSLVLSASAAFQVDRSVMSDRYWAIWNDDVQAKISADIEKYRKADAEIAVEAPADAEVTVEQISHAFFFGAHIFNFNQLGKTEWNNRYKELYGTLFNSATVAFYWRTLEPYPYANRFEERYEDTENFWNNCPQPKDQPHWRRPAPDPVISHLKTRGCRIHGHPLIWGNNEWHTPTWLWDDFCPESEKLALEQATGVKMPRRDFRFAMGVKDVPRCFDWGFAWAHVYAKLSEEQIAALVPTFVQAQKDFFARRIAVIGERYGNRVDSWDVVNESATDWGNDAKRTWPAGESAAVNKLPVSKSRYGLMPANYAYEAIVQSRKVMGKRAWLNINEYNMDAFTGQIADLNAHGADFDVVGSQMHLFNPAESVNIAAGEGPVWLRPEAVAENFVRVTKAAGGRPIHLSEITITAPDNSPRGQMVQAIIMRNLYRAWFSVEKMSGITWWNVVDDCGAPGEPSISGLFTRDMRPKTAYFAMDDLVNREWKTRLRLKVEVDGGQSRISFRGFRGNYRLTWKGADGKECSKLVEVK